MTNLDEKHLEKFLECYRAIRNEPGLWHKARKATLGRSASAWWQTVCEPKGGAKKPELVQVKQEALSREPLGRFEIRRRIEDCRTGQANVRLEEVLVELMTWGLMKYGSARSAFAHDVKWIEVCRELLQEKWNPIDAYDRFHTLKKKDRRGLPGIGPAYYTKLIFFLGDGTGLIMDQWTARSACLLWEQDGFLKLEGANVSQRNTKDDYERFLGFVEQLRLAINDREKDDLELADVEWLLFSFSPHKRLGNLDDKEMALISGWRDYVIKNDGRTKVRRPVLS